MKIPVRIAVRILTGIACVSAAFISLSANAADAKPTKGDTRLLERGRYMVKIAGCNDCHTAGYAEAGGNIPEAEWLKGDILGWSGPWGTTYPANLRLYFQNVTADQWVKTARTLQTRPPMPWFALHAMTERDLRAIYQLAKYLGPGGQPAPAYVPPDQEPKQPYIQFPQPPKQ